MSKERYRRRSVRHATRARRARSSPPDPKNGKVIVEGVHRRFPSIRSPASRAKRAASSSARPPSTPARSCWSAPSAASPPASAQAVIDGEKVRVCKQVRRRYLREEVTEDYGLCARLKRKYNEEVAPALMQKFQYKSVMQIPTHRQDRRVTSAAATAKDNAKALDAVVKDICAITGQQAVATVARKSPSRTSSSARA